MKANLFLKSLSTEYVNVREMEIVADGIPSTEEME